MIDKLTIFGVGLIGGSLALALKDAGFCKQVVGCSRNADHLQRAVDLGVIDSFTLDAADAVQGADVVLLAVPMGAMHTVLSAIKPALPDHTVLTDAGSTKGSIVAEVADVFGDDFTRFVPGHPIAGREKSGVEAALPALYQNRRVILTPNEQTDKQAIETIESMWQATGANVEHLSVQTHDAVLAATSHLPHVLAFSIVDTLLNSSRKDAILRYAAGGFKDFTRIASSDPVMWRDICLANRDEILAMIAAFQDNLSEFADMIRDEERVALQQRMESSRQAREDFIAQFDAG